MVVSSGVGVMLALLRSLAETFDEAAGLWLSFDGDKEDRSRARALVESDAWQDQQLGLLMLEADLEALGA